ncbi:MAG: putative DNA binding domain-containing protein [Xanthomonadales bacterium]|nr:putative DNA binding domain-containing protein [Xanthomonadales bacterium]
MTLDPQKLLDRIQLGEDSLLELKQVQIQAGRMTAPHRNGLADEFAAFANARGGLCVLGVEDGSRQVIGIPIDALDTVEAAVQAVCHDLIDPPLQPHIERLRLPDASGHAHAVLVVDVPRSLFVHRSPGGYLIRSGSSKRTLRSEQLARLFQLRSQTGIIHFDEELLPHANLDVLQTRLWRRFAPAGSREQKTTLLHKLGMARQDEQGTWRPTVAGVLTACAHPEQHLPNAWIQAVAYRGETPVPDAAGLYQLDAADITGPLDRQVADACRFVARNMKVRASKRIGRVDRPQYDLTAVFEALVNAVAHRDYALHGARIRLRMFADRLELNSPGGLPNTLDTGSLPYRQFSRNETLTSLLARCPVPADIPGLDSPRACLMDRRGEGVPIILARSKRISGHLPVYTLHDDSELQLTIRAAES